VEGKRAFNPPTGVRFSLALPFMRLFGQEVDTTGLECERGGDHRRLVAEARVDCLHRALNPDDRYVLCSRCAKVVTLKI
jgi:hypothetical protein